MATDGGPLVEEVRALSLELAHILAHRRVRPRPIRATRSPLPGRLTGLLAGAEGRRMVTAARGWEVIPDVCIDTAGRLWCHEYIYLTFTPSELYEADFYRTWQLVDLDRWVRKFSGPDQPGGPYVMLANHSVRRRFTHDGQAWLQFSWYQWPEGLPPALPIQDALLAGAAALLGGAPEDIIR